MKNKNSLNISVVILTYNEEIHLRRCLNNIIQFADDIFIVDSFSIDNTITIAKEYGVYIYQNKWENNYAKQFNWALTHCPIKTKWVLRLDADEYLSVELIQELRNRLNDLTINVTGVIFKRRHIFLEKWMKRGTYPVQLLRLFQFDKAICENRLMDEHIQLLEGEPIVFENDFIDHNLNNLSWWITKHNGYAIREAVDLLDIELHLTGSSDSDDKKLLGKQAESKRNKKHKYVRLPLFWRAFFFFCYRYFLKMSFLEGKEAFLWTFFQCWWYRTLVDAKIFEIKKACGNDKDKIVTYLKEKYSIDCNNL